MSTTTDVTRAFQEIQESLESIKNDETQRFPVAASVGDYIRQGDILITLMEKPEGVSADPILQLAPGTTKGSRHILSHGDVGYYARTGNDLVGPCIQPRREVTVTHPEHGDWVLPADGRTYGITYERAMAEEIRRVAD